jgi:hypothetical protein
LFKPIERFFKILPAKALKQDRSPERRILIFSFIIAALSMEWGPVSFPGTPFDISKGKGKKRNPISNN